jgi:hypothetical protein
MTTRVNTIYNSIYKATSIPRLNIISTDSDDSISEVNNITKNEENDGVDIATQEKKNSISGITINIYDASGQIGMNNNLVNNSTVCNNINENNNNTSVLNEENTPGEVNSESKLESVDSYPLNIQTEIPRLRLRGGVGDEEKEEMVEETVGERFILTTLDEEESEANGGRMEDAKLPGMIRILKLPKHNSPFSFLLFCLYYQPEVSAIPVIFYL